ncbi:hypothetical protein E1180_03085 [Roseibium denhamense]|uniref:Sulfatase N-terminal domain-containing protein n=1 Tax=Roseibium denhamense TaxID=76305 RepID=A0ABY1P8D7_9HYPH|nr:sulfatase-like hydrolase/transferase [Roseibium denhamense]MTI04502.1 hypothetical protein [Roseibium denhamense]SMP28713.1 hypothetical protein SAMN06265374_2980 [Roseibium denhamense]
MRSTASMFMKARSRLKPTRESLLFSVLAVLLPNSVYILLSLLYCPVRTPLILGLSGVCLAGLFLPRFLFFILLLIVMVLDALLLVAGFFQMPIPMLFDSLQYAGNISISSSITYLALLGLLTASFIATFIVVSEAKKNRNAINLFLFIGVLFSYAGIDWWLNSEPHAVETVRNRFVEPFSPISDAASLHTGLGGDMAEQKPRNILIVMVEGLGAFTSEELQNIVWGPLLESDVRSGYAVETGSAVYFGSTTAGEVRELCHVKGDYRDFRDRDTADCLPAQAAAAGYKTAAFHAFTGAFFERFDWFPKIGFQALFFMENRLGIEEDVKLEECGLSFRGLCDTDAGTAVEQYLLQDPAARKFVYWLTLNSHKPIRVGEVPARLGCEEGGNVFGDVELCRMSDQWLNISHIVRDIALNPDIAETEVLVVGDHHPPLFTRSGRKLFQPGRVAWLHLKPKAAGGQDVTAFLPDVLRGSAD